MCVWTLKMKCMCAHVSSCFKDLESSAALWPSAFPVYLGPNLYLGEFPCFFFYAYSQCLEPQLPL